MTIYIQSNLEETLPYDFDAASALFGAIDLGWDWDFISYSSIIAGDFDDRRSLYVGTVEFLTHFFNALGLAPRVPRNSNREEEVILLKEARSRIKSGEVIFVKPQQIKLFTGMLMEKFYISYLSQYPEDTKVIVSKPFNSEVDSEWRCYIRDERIVDIKNYSGNPFNAPNEEYVKRVISEDCTGFPVAYTIDVGVLENKDNVVVEFNDMWAIGNYGMSNDQYLKLLLARWREIIK